MAARKAGERSAAQTFCPPLAERVDCGETSSGLVLASLAGLHSMRRSVDVSDFTVRPATGARAQLDQRMQAFCRAVTIHAFVGSSSLTSSYLGSLDFDSVLPFRPSRLEKGPAKLTPPAR